MSLTQTRQRGWRTGASWLFTLTLTLFSASALSAQSVAVTPIAPLTFSQVIPGVPLTVAPSATTAGKLRIDTQKLSTIIVAFALPTSLTNGGSALPLTFSGQSAGWSEKDRPTSATLFDPAAGFQDAVKGKKTVYVWLGGTVTPAPSQAAGSYSATITVTVIAN